MYRHVIGFVVAFLLFSTFGSIDQAAAANRSLTLHNTHTKETTTIVYKRNGKFDADGLRKLNRFLRDWRRNESTQMDPALFDLIWQVYKMTGAKKPIHVVSGYRSPATNNMLRSRSRGVAKNSRHTKGQAMDFYLPGVPISKIRNAGLRLQAGGVGYYPGSRSPFVHIDTGNVRHWPRMTRKQLARVFPDGKTVHVPSDGKPFSGYKVAKAQVAKVKANMIRSSRSARRFTQVAKAAPASTSTRSASNRTVQLAKQQQQQTTQQGSLLQKLLNRTPKAPPKPVFTQKAPATAPVATAEAPVAAQQSSMPTQLAALPRRPVNRPAPTPVPEAPIAPEDPASAVAEAAQEAQVGELVQLASLPRTRPQGLIPANSPFQLASTEPAPEPKTVSELLAEKAKADAAAQGIQTATAPATGELAEPAGDNRLTLASLPKSKQGPLAPDTTTVASVPPAQPADAREVLNALAPQNALSDEAASENRFAYASADRTFLATLPSQRPKTILSAQDDKLASLPKGATRQQLASLPENPPIVNDKPEGLLAALPRASATPQPAQQRPQQAAPARPATAPQKQLERLTFAYGPSGMSHFAHMKQSTKTATFARLSRPIPNNLSALVSKPESVIDQTFSRQSVQLLADNHFAGPAIARMSVRSFN